MNEAFDLDDARVHAHETRRELRAWVGNDNLKILLYMGRAMQLGLEFDLRDDRGGSGHYWMVFHDKTLSDLRKVFGKDPISVQIDPSFVL